MTIEQILEIIERYKLRIPPTVYYDLLADIREAEEEQKPTTKNDLGVDCISRKAVTDELKRYFHDEYYQRTSIQDCRDCFIEDVLNHLPSVTPQEPTGKKFTKADIDAIVKAINTGWELRVNEILDKIRAEIDKARFVDKDTRICKNALASGLEVAMQIIDKYKAETEG